MDRVTRKVLEQQVAILNEKNGGLLQNNLELDYAECCGGYCLVDKTYSIHLTPRMSGREMRQYLRGALDWITPLATAALTTVETRSVAHAGGR